MGAEIYRKLAPAQRGRAIQQRNDEHRIHNQEHFHCRVCDEYQICRVQERRLRHDWLTEWLRLCLRRHG
jgi:hypothetical protein